MILSNCFVTTPRESETCVVAPMVEFMVTLAPCLEETCGRYGKCKEFISGVHIYSACDCFAGR